MYPLIEGLVGVDLTTVSTEYPVLARGIYPFKIGETKITKSNAGDPMLELRFELQKEAQDTKGSPIQPGYVVMHNIMLKPTGKATPQMIAANIAELQDAVFGTRIPLDSFDTDSLAGQDLTIKTAVRPADEAKGYGERAIVANHGLVKKSV